MTDERLSTRLETEVSERGLTYAEASQLMGEPPNSVSRWISLTVAPSPEKWPAIAEFLRISEVEVATALARDRIALRESRRTL